MSWLAGILRLIYELVVGDSPALAVAIVAVLAASVVLLSLDALPQSLVVLGISAALFVVAPSVIIGEVKATRVRGSKTEAETVDEI